MAINKARLGGKKGKWGRGGIVRKRAKKTAKRKIKSISKLMKEADALFSKKVRMTGAFKPEGSDEWWNRCFTCGGLFLVKKLNCGHYLSRFYKSARWDEDNCRPQCMMCNLWKRGDPIVFRQNLIEEIGEARVLAVEAKRKDTIKLTREFLDAQIQSEYMEKTGYNY